MSRRNRAVSWPWVCGLACLLIVSLTAPRVWEERARQRAHRQAMLGQKSAHGTAPAATIPGGPRQPERPLPARSESRAASSSVGAPQAPAGALALVDRPANPPQAAPMRQTAEEGLGLADVRPPAMAADTVPPEPMDHRPAAGAEPAHAPPQPIGEAPAPASSSPDRAVAPAAPVEVAHRPARQDRPAEARSKQFPLEPPQPESGVPRPAETSETKTPLDPPADGWQEPTALLDYLDELLAECETGAWALAVQRELRRLKPALLQAGPEAVKVLNRLQQLGRQGWTLAEGLQDPALATKVRRACYALDRRHRVWEEAAAAGGLRAPIEDRVDPDPQRLALCLGQVDALFQGSPQGRLWSQFLTLDALGQLATHRAQADRSERRQLARSVLDRLARARLDEAQRRVVQHPAVVALREELRRWAIEPAEWATLLGEIERYEAAGLPSDGRRVAERIQQLALSPLAERRQLAQHLAAHYRNANVRIAASVEFLSRLIPERPEEVACVEDCVLGRPVRGQRVTTSEVTVRMIPDATKLRLALQVDGLVDSLTQSIGGPARFINASQATYSAWKELEIGPEGMRILPAEVCVHNELRLRGVSTDFDGLPLLGALAHELARSGHECRRAQANAEIEAKVCARAKAQVDAEADARLRALAAEIRQRLLEPLAEASLGPEFISAETSEQRAVLRVRLAAEDQLAAHTPRPMAPGDALASVQIHESALTNLMARVGIDGRTFTLAEVRRRLAERLQRPAATMPSSEDEAADEDMTVTFAPRDALRLRCAEGQVVLTVSIARLVHNGRSYEDFQVRAVYRPQVQGLDAELVRDEAIYLSGPRLSTRAQFTLRSIFSKAFSRYKPWALLPERITREPRLQGLAVTQLVVEDGWLGVAIGPARPDTPAVACRADR